MTDDSTLTLDSFEALVEAARAQPEGQRFLFVFLKAELPGGSSDAQAERFEAGEGGALVPVMYADKGRYEVSDFNSLVAEAQHTAETLGQDDMDGAWDIVIVGCLGGFGEREPGALETEQALDELRAAIRTGRSLARFAAFDRDGTPVRFH
ncbi:MAG: ribonucleotide reductase subunit alpha [Gammaproteobacteria bacterium]|nr:ribonucleotide reductase subunit alpha [Gammaproteobacteria bacterium]